MRVGNFDNDYPGWVRVTTSDGNDGWAPADIIAIEKDKGLGTALHSYCARELNVEPGDVLTVIKEKLGWCWCEDQNGSAGWVPREIGELI